jgi:phosphate-selective porin OprO and OprP
LAAKVKSTLITTLTTTAGAFSDLSKSAKSAKTWTAGVNWYLNKNAKFALNYAQTKFDGGAIETGQSTIDASGSRVRDREDEKAVLARFQVAF